ncbi:unnamed protein product [Darwinula stevensoni]|uniref:Alpha N-terminal protein methyltransferase 1 n=1 Tax=Darwinula stevensoni TaxID=69355 RepID=A0A7R9A409_9CRUS|nr:unnamed protein product [Darwinula stevensoni]CAG0892690.1 unnamed protein product [Darwinula stevensoni]
MSSENSTSSCAFYDDAEKYWQHISPTVSGMLGGHADVHQVDIEGSNKFLTALFRQRANLGTERACDCGAGIGRITKTLLQKYFSVIDLVEQNEAFLDEARTNILKDSTKVGQFFCTGLQNFTPEPKTYDVIWCQWVLGHLTDDDLLAFFTRCKTGLRGNGILVVKENVTSNGDVDFDQEDSSVTRPAKLLKELIRKAGFNLIKETKQRQFPSDLYPVYMYAAAPSNPHAS